MRRTEGEGEPSRRLSEGRELTLEGPVGAGKEDSSRGEGAAERAPPRGVSWEREPKVAQWQREAYLPLAPPRPQSSVLTILAQGRVAIFGAAA
jgi:hypothetical protein